MGISRGKITLWMSISILSQLLISFVIRTMVNGKWTEVAYLFTRHNGGGTHGKPKECLCSRPVQITFFPTLIPVNFTVTKFKLSISSVGYLVVSHHTPVRTCLFTHCQSSGPRKEQNTYNYRQCSVQLVSQRFKSCISTLQDQVATVCNDSCYLSCNDHQMDSRESTELFNWQMSAFCCETSCMNRCKGNVQKNCETRPLLGMLH